MFSHVLKTLLGVNLNRLIYLFILANGLSAPLCARGGPAYRKICPCYGPNVQLSLQKKKNKKPTSLKVLFLVIIHGGIGFPCVFLLLSFHLPCAQKKRRKSPSRRLNYSRRQYLFKNKLFIFWCKDEFYLKENRLQDHICPSAHFSISAYLKIIPNILLIN